MKLYNRDGIWWLDVTLEGKRLRVSTKKVSKTEANLFAKEYLAGVIGGKKPSNTYAKEGLTLEEALDRAYRTNWRTHKDLSGYISNGKHITELLGGKVLLKTITSKTVAKLREDFLALNLKPATVNNKMAVLSSLMNIACSEWEEIDVVPTFKRFKTNNARTRLVSVAEEQEAINWFRSNGESTMADLVIVLIDTGMRLSESLRIKPADVDFERKFLRVLKSKNDEPRSVPLTERVMAVLNSRMQNDPLFSDMTDHGASHRWVKMTKFTGKDDDKEYVLHALRHTCATRLLESGVDIYTVKEWLGHKDINTTMRYAKMTNMKLRDALTKFEARV